MEAMERFLRRKMERATGIEPVLPAWESEFSILYFQHLQNRSAKMFVHATHTLHTVPDLRVAGGRLEDGCSQKFFDHFEVVFGDRESA